MPVPRTRPGRYPPLLSYGFRPFFFFGAIYGGVSIIAFPPMLAGMLEMPSLFLPVDWHVHELLFGCLAAIVAGFLLTAIPNWTGRLPVQGMPLAILALLWLAGRFAVFLSAEIGWLAALAVDVAFLFALAVSAGVEIVAGRNWRNLKVLAPVLVLFAANVLFHLEAYLAGIADVGRRLGLAAAIVLIMIIGGAHHPQLHPQLAGSGEPRSSAGSVQPLHRDAELAALPHVRRRTTKRCACGRISSHACSRSRLGTASVLHPEAVRSRSFAMAFLVRLRIFHDQPARGPLASCGRLASPAR